jgi:hypothetical protein
MGLYRKKPVVIEAVQWEPSFTGQRQILELCSRPNEVRFDIKGGRVYIETLEGTMIAQCGDWIIKGVKGELYPCKPEIFEATYEKV